MCLAFPDVCKVPAPPAPFIPTPFPNTGQCADASDCTENVKILNKAVIHANSKISSTHGDEAGTLKGMISATTGDQAVWKSASSAVKVEGNYIVTHLKPTAHNGNNANAPPGTQVAPSQMQVMIGS
jgi:hypothetical protein